MSDQEVMDELVTMSQEIIQLKDELYEARAELERVRVLDQSRLSIPRPVVPFGPEGVPENIATANYMRDVIFKIDHGYANVGGSKVTATVRKLLQDVATALEES